MNTLSRALSMRYLTQSSQLYDINDHQAHFRGANWSAKKRHELPKFTQLAGCRQTLICGAKASAVQHLKVQVASYYRNVNCRSVCIQRNKDTAPFLRCMQSGRQTRLILRVAQTKLQITEVKSKPENRFSHRQGRENKITGRGWYETGKLST